MSETLTGPGETLMFSYASHMSSKQLLSFCPKARPVMAATLFNHRIEFRKNSADLDFGGISTVIPAPGDAVHGVLNVLPNRNVAALDRIEELDRGLYERPTFLVLGADGKTYRADLYRIVDPEEPFAPSPDYVAMMIEGAKEHGLPEAYIEHLRQFLVDGPDQKSPTCSAENRREPAFSTAPSVGVNPLGD